MARRKSFWLVGSLLALLVLALCAQFLFQIGRPPSAAIMPAEVIPAVLPGVEIKDLPVAETELVSKAVEEGLGFSDYRYREYRKDGVQFAVYLAYWQDRKRHFMDLGTHAPDNCWVSNGWTMDPKHPKRVFKVQATSLSPSGSALAGPVSGIGSLQPSGFQFQVSSASPQVSSVSPQISSLTWPAESRTFHAGGNTIQVVYWHLLDGKPLDYTRYGTGKTVGYLLDNIGHYWQGTAEQYFLRISSSRPVDELERDPTFQAVLSSLVAHTPLAAH